MSKIDEIKERLYEDEIERDDLEWLVGQYEELKFRLDGLEK